MENKQYKLGKHRKRSVKKVESRSKFAKCVHECRACILSVSFWAGVSLSFPIEHFLWEKVFPFYLITQFLGL